MFKPIHIYQVILKDKSKIEAVIEELDLKKAQALQATWIKVNQDFGSIFSTLLPVEYFLIGCFHSKILCI